MPTPPPNPRYVPGDTNWERYELAELVSMVNDEVDLRTLGDLAEDWQGTGRELVGAAEDLADALDRLMDFWSGATARQARTDVALNAQWLGDLGDTAVRIGPPIDEAASALRYAQAQMPEVPAVDRSVLPASAPDGAMLGEAAGGPMGASIGGAAAAMESAAQAAEAEADAKRQAVEVMRRFETVAMSVDEAIPVFEGPDPVLRPPAHPRPPVPPPPPPVVVIINPGEGTWDELTRQPGSGTSAQQYEGGGRGGGEHGSRVGAGGGSLGGLTLSPTGGFGAGGRGSGSRASGPPSGTGAVPGERAGLPGVNPAAALSGPDGHPTGGGGMGGAPMGAGMGAGAGAGGANDHRRRFPVDADDPFALDKKASPPVIGI